MQQVGTIGEIILDGGAAVMFAIGTVLVVQREEFPSCKLFSS